MYELMKGNSSMSSEALINPVLLSGIPNTSDLLVLKGEACQTFFLVLCVYVFLKSKFWNKHNAIPFFSILRWNSKIEHFVSQGFYGGEVKYLLFMQILCKLV